MTVLSNFFPAHQSIMEIEISRVRGSSPREEGARIYVSPATQCGTIGGGQLEYMAIDKARSLLRQQSIEVPQIMDVPLGPEIGQCCGGRVELTLTLMNQQLKQQRLREEVAEIAKRPAIYLFGAGHVGRALANSLSLLPVRPVLIDSRKEELALCRADIETYLTPLPEERMRMAAPGSTFVIATHDHALDFLLAREALARRDACYVGMIGSKSKAARFRHWLAGEAPELSAKDLICPMAKSVAVASEDKRPEVIAALITAELIAALNQGALVQKPLRSKVSEQ
ncbi:xanthine dehydrogenase accessory protein XdhC [Cohaesibacter gelatinilyticus]|uniref:Xanthine dehydrogenase accessory factor n=1 Tax=Cohaesibacter gelatinilyticus TaxID=372072 RepID=A0A285NB06_9HYPH|nr:xanthine dehydrogenase accessory protein XdhC [Cohaesibacter gelatinilyticus]SNZ06674.1 xanthine dehydrogenase accessory factor [Cohaesibacter gelatinilyticus]